jgi:hypothetical protein
MISRKDARVSKQPDPDPSPGTQNPTDPEAPGAPRVAAPSSGADKRRSGRSWLSYALFALAAILFAVAIAMYLRDDDGGSNQIPAAPPGNNQLGHVVTAFEGQGLDTEYGRTADRAIGLTEVAQPIVVDGTTVYVFIYPDPAQRQRDQDRLDPAALQIVNTRGTPVAEGVPQVFGGSNVLVAVYSDDAELLKSIQSAIEGMS